MKEKPVGIRELKVNLSKYLKKIKEGSGLLISQRGKTIARIIPVASEKKNELPSLLLKLSTSAGPQQLHSYDCEQGYYEHDHNQNKLDLSPQSAQGEIQSDLQYF